MNCERFKNSFYGYLEGQLTAEDRERFEAHKTQCRACAELYDIGTELTCRDFVEALDDYVEGRMPPDREAVFERHLSVCPDCTAYLDSYRRTMSLTRALQQTPKGAIPEDVPEDLVRAILAARRR